MFLAPFISNHARSALCHVILAPCHVTLVPYHVTDAPITVDSAGRVRTEYAVAGANVVGEDTRVNILTLGLVREDLDQGFSTASLENRTEQIDLKEGNVILATLFCFVKISRYST